MTTVTVLRDLFYSRPVKQVCETVCGSVAELVTGVVATRHTTWRLYCWWPVLSTGARHRRVIFSLHPTHSNLTAVLAIACVGLSTGPVDKSLADVGQSLTVACVECVYV